MDKKITSSEKKKTKKVESVKCAKCGLEYSESGLSADHQNEAFYEWDNKILCKDCLVMNGGLPASTLVYDGYLKDPNKGKAHDW
jgi:hypothetical protein